MPPNNKTEDRPLTKVKKYSEHEINGHNRLAAVRLAKAGIFVTPVTEVVPVV